MRGCARITRTYVCEMGQNGCIFFKMAPIIGISLVLKAAPLVIKGKCPYFAEKKKKKVHIIRKKVNIILAHTRKKDHFSEKS